MLLILSIIGTSVYPSLAPAVAIFLVACFTFHSDCIIFHQFPSENTQIGPSKFFLSLTKINMDRQPTSAPVGFFGQNRGFGEHRF
jgi:hypothetical protein